MQGQEFPDWAVESTDPSVNSCTALKGQTIGVDAIGGIRYIALQQMLKTCGLSISDVHPIAFPGNANPQALVDGQLKVSGPAPQRGRTTSPSQGKTLTTAVTMSTAVPDTMYEMYGATEDQPGEEAGHSSSGSIAAQIATIKWMDDPNNADAVAQYATVTGDKKADLLKAMADYRTLNFWTTTDAALPQTNVDNTIKGQVAAGNVKAAKAPTYSDIVDLSVYTDAAKLVGRSSGS